MSQVPPWGEGYADVAIDDDARQVHFTSGTTISTEALVDGRWLIRYRATDGRVRFADESWDDTDAFELRLRFDPASPNADGTSLSGTWEWDGASIEPSPQADVRHCVVNLISRSFPVSVSVHTLLDATPVITRWLEITVTSGQAIALKSVCPLSGRLWPRNSTFKLGYFTRTEAGRQGWFEWQTLADGTTSILGNQGAAHDDPFFILSNESKGEYAIAHFAYSADYFMEFDRAKGGGLAFRLGAAQSDALRVIAGGETIRTPATHLGLLERDFDTAVQAMHEHIRSTVLPRPDASRIRRIQFCLPGDTAYLGLPVYVDTEMPDFNEATVLASVDVAAATGAEVFVLDAWWWEWSGHWIPSSTSFPRGLTPIVDRVRDKGMLFGLYVESEGGRGDWSKSPVGMEHPDWFVRENILNLTKPEVAEHVASELARIVDEYDVDLYRHDFNTHSSIGGAPAHRGGLAEDNAWRYYEALYRIFEDLHVKYPALVLQQAAGGCQRTDLGMVSRFHEAFIAEGGQPGVFRAYSGLTLALPPEIMVIGIGNVRDRGHLETHLRAVHTLGTPFIISGVAPSVEELTPVVQERYRHHADVYKRFIRPMMDSARVYHHAPVNARGGVESSAWFAMEYAAPDRSKAWATVVRMADDVYTLKPRGLDPGGRYKVTFDGAGAEVTLNGLNLIRHGVPIRLESVLSSELLLFEAVE